MLTRAIHSLAVVNVNGTTVTTPDEGTTTVSTGYPNYGYYPYPYSGELPPGCNPRSWAATLAAPAAQSLLRTGLAAERRTVVAVALITTPTFGVAWNVVAAVVRRFGSLWW